MLDFQEWKEVQPQIVSLKNLSESVAKLNSIDAETEAPNSRERRVDYYLPDPLKRQIFSRIEELQKCADYHFHLSEELSELGQKGECVSELKSSTILSAVVTEILRNHYPHSAFEVRISDG